MADISSIGGAGEARFRASAAERTTQNPADHARIESARRSRQADTVSLSDAARTAAQAEPAEVRTELTSRVRAELDAGTYVTQDKLDAAVEKLVGEILGS